MSFGDWLECVRVGRIRGHSSARLRPRKRRSVDCTPALIQTLEPRLLLTGTGLDPDPDATYAAQLELSGQILRTQAADLLATQEQRDQDLAALQAASNARIESALGQFTQDHDDNVTDYNNRRQTRDNDHQQAIEDIQTAFDDGNTAANDGHAGRLAANQQAYQTAVNAAESAFDTAIAAADSAYSASVAILQADYQSAMDTAGATYDAAVTAADSAYTTAEETAWNAYVAGYDAAVAAYETAQQSAASARDAALAGISNASSYDLGVVGEDQNYQAAMAAAQSAYTAAIQAVKAGYQTAMTAAINGYSQAVAAANAGFDAALLAADTAYEAAVDAANLAYYTAVDAANTAFDGQVASLQQAFTQTVTAASNAYDTAVQTATTNYNQAVQDAEDQYTTDTQQAQNDYNSYVANAPRRYQLDVLNAAKTYIQNVLNEQYAQGETLFDAAETRAQGILGILNGYNDSLDGWFDPVTQAYTTAMQELGNTAQTAYNTYQDAVNAPVGNGNSNDYEAYMAAYQEQMRQAVISYFTTIGNEAVGKLDTVGQAYVSAITSLAGDAAQAGTQAAEKDKTYAEAAANAANAVRVAIETGQATFLSAVAGLNTQYTTEAKEKAATLEKKLNEAKNQRTRDLAKAEADRARANAAAAKTFSDAVADAEETYVEGYAQAWDQLQSALGTAGEAHTRAVMQADDGWITSVLAADIAWATQVSVAKANYRTAANAAATAAQNGVYAAETAYASAVNSAWASAVQSAYSGDPDAVAVAAAWTAYSDAMLAAWVAVDQATTSAALAYFSAESTADIAHGDAVAQAFSARVGSESQAGSMAIDASLAAARQYDDSWRPAVVDWANEIAAAENGKAKSDADSDKQLTDDLAGNFEQAETADADADQSYIQESVDELTGLFNSFEQAAGGLVQGLMGESGQAASSQLGADLQTTIEEIGQLKTMLEEGANAIKAQWIRNATRAVQQAKAALQQWLSTLPGLSYSQTEQMVMSISSGVPSQVSDYFYGFAYDQGLTEQIREKIEALISETEMELDYAVYYNMPPGAPGAESVLKAAFGLAPDGGQAISDLEGTWVGTLDVATGMVRRSVHRGGRVVQRAETMAAVQAQIDFNMPGFGAAGWNGFFGGQALDPVPAEEQPIHVQIITNWVGAETLAQPGGMGSTLIITVGLVTEITSTLDPTPLSDLLNATTQAINGNWGDAAITVSLSLAPGSAAALSKFANRVPLGQVDDVAQQLARRSDDLAAINHATPSPGTITRTCPDGLNCFVAGTQVVLREADEPVMAALSETAEGANETILAGAGLIAVGVALDRVRRRTTKPALRLKSSRPARDDDNQPEVPVITPPPKLNYSFQLTEPPPEPAMPALMRKDSPSSQLRRRSFGRAILTAAMLACFAVGGWLLAPAVWPQPLDAVASALPTSSAPHYVTKNIEDIQVGDLVLARDEHGREIGYRPVKEVYRRTSRHLRHLTFKDAAGRQQQLQTTDEHPFWSVTRNQFIDAGKLRIDERFTSPDGRLQSLIDTRREERPDGVAVFNFQVEGYHTYFVHAAGHDQPILVHNAQYNVDGGQLTESAALDQAERWLGSGHREIAPGVFRSKDNLRQFRMTTSDLTDPVQGPHVHFESIGPNGRDIIENSHVWLIP